MDPFTQRMMERARMRREKLDNEMAAVGQSDAKRLRTPLLDENFTKNTTTPNEVPIQLKGDFQSKSSALTSSQKPIIVHELEKENSENVPEPLDSRSNLSKRLNRLGKLYTDSSEGFSSPVHHSETLSRYANPTNNTGQPKSCARTARLAALARSIEEWEDDLTNLSAPSILQSKPQSPVRVQQVSPAHTFIKSPSRPATTSAVRALANSPVKAGPSSPLKPSASSPAKGPTGSPVQAVAAHASEKMSPSPLKVQMGSRALSTKNQGKTTTSLSILSTKTMIWDKAIFATLEAQGYVPTKSRSRLIYDFEANSSQQDEDHSDEVREILHTGDGLLDEQEDCYMEPCSSANVSISSPGWVYQAGSPAGRNSPRMGLQSPVKRVIANAQLGSPNKPSFTGRAQSPLASPVTSKVVTSPCKSPTKVSRDLKTMSPGSVLQRAAMFELAAANNSSPGKDPAELSLAQRMALFEKNKSEAPLLPKVAFSTPLPAKFISKSAPVVSVPISKPELKQDESKAKFVKENESSKGISKVQAQKAMFEKSLQFSQGPPKDAVEAQSERQKELELLRNRWDKQKKMSGNKIELNTPHNERVELKQMRDRWNSESELEITAAPPPPPMPTPSSPTKSTCSSKSASRKSPVKQYPVLDTVRKIRVSPAKQGKIYPSLSDIDATESEMDPESSEASEASIELSSDDENSSFGQEILQAAGLHREKSPVKRVANEMSASECAVLNDIDDFLNEAMGSDSESVSVGPTPPKKSRENEVKGKNDTFNFRTPCVREVAAPASNQNQPEYVVEAGGQALPLMHTVSFYRKQQSNGSRLATPVRQVHRLPEVESSSDEVSSPERIRKAVQSKLSSLYEEVSRQQTIISQASQALNLCRSTIEFSNSAEQVAAEKLLLVATNKRQAALHEIQRLKVEGTLHPFSEYTETGSLTISNLTLPLKKEFLHRARRSDDDSDQYMVCLVRCQEHVLASTMLATSSLAPRQEALIFPGEITLNNLSSDFAVKLEVYTLEARRESLSHEAKYHIKKDANKMRLTPKKQKHESLLVMPVVQSPAGPSAVRSPSFSLSGYTVFSLREINRKHFTLNKVPYSSPLEGHIDIKLSCELHLDIEQRGFLTMFEDVSGFGAWHRRWCVLDAGRLSFWKYPDDERKKEPIGWIDLNVCCTKQVGPVSRDVCARPNTFLLETRRTPQPDDRDSLVMVLGEKYTTLRHLLSADTREERMQWCSELTRALVSMRAWRSSTTSSQAATSL